MNDSASQTGKVPKGYKFTDVGLIPEDWSVKPLSAFADVKTGPFGSALHESDYVSDGTPIITVEHLSDQGVVHENLPLVSDVDRNRLSSYSLRAGDIVFSRVGSVDRNALIRDAENGWLFSGRLLRVRTLGDDIHSSYVSYHFHSESFKQRVRTVAVGQTMASLNTKILKGVLVVLPLESEQRAIAKALSDVDGLLGSLEKLIAKKQAIKRATMQQLLTGKTRLPGFTGKWETKRLGEFLLHLIGGGTPSRRIKAYWGGSIPWMTVKDFTSFTPTGTEESITEAGLAESSSNLIPSHTVIVATRMAVGHAAMYDVQVAINQDLKALVTSSDLVPRYLLRWLEQNRASLELLGSGSTVKGLSSSELRRFIIAVPAMKEQEAIVAVLTDMDSEIGALERRRDKTKQIKQGMMQQLLTGRIRLVRPSVKASEKMMAQTGARRANIHFMRSVLAAEIIDQLHEQPTFGHVKFEKVMFLVEHLCDVETGSTYHRKAAGPYDNRALRSIDSQLRAQQWFDARKEGERYWYVPMENRGGHKRYFDRYFSGIGDTFEKILDTFKTLDTERCGIVATLLAAWSDLLREKGTASDEMIVHEVLNNWHESKRRIPEDRWLKALGWMRSQGFVPKGNTYT